MIKLELSQDPILASSEKTNLGYGSGKNGHSTHSKIHPSYARSSSIDGSVVSFHDITYTVRTKENRKNITKTILTDIK